MLVLRTHDNIAVEATTEDGESAVELAQTLRPDVIIMDVSMPKLNGIEAARKIHKTQPDIKIIFVSMYSNYQYIQQALEVGASGYLIKQSAASVLIEAVLTVASGETYFSPTIAKTVLDIAREPEGHANSEGLTPREMEIMKLLASGKTSNAISKQLFISRRTVDKHRENIMRKLNIRDVAGLTRYAISNKLIEP